MSAPPDVPPPDAFEPVLPIEPRSGRSIARRLVGPLCFAIVIGVLFVLWYGLYQHIAAMTVISMRGGNVHWELNQGRWTRGGESSVDFRPGTWSAEKDKEENDDAITSLSDLNHVVSLDLSNRIHQSPPSYDVLKRLPDLQYLYLSYQHDAGNPAGVVVTDAALPNVAGHSRLVELYLDGNPITDIGLASLKALPRLEVIDLSGTGVTDAGLKHLLSLPNLKTIHVEGTKVTDAGIDAFLRVRPEVEILRTNPKTDLD